MSILRRVFDAKISPVLAAVCIVLFVAESRRRLRKRTQPRWKRVVTNSVVAIPAFFLLRFLLLPIMIKVAMKNRQIKAGLNYQYTTHPVVKGCVAFLLLDYTNYLWHVLMHKLPLLWRFHVVHHSDLDLDITTAFRFHFGELIGSVLYRGAAVFAIGASPLTVILYEGIFEGATQFHHSNWRLPFATEKALSKIFVTPRMHGIHHSTIREETDSNYSVIFSVWDRLHRTLRLNVPQDLTVTGVPTYSNPEELTIGNLWKLPFTKIRTWQVLNEVRDVRGSASDKSTLAE